MNQDTGRNESKGHLDSRWSPYNGEQMADNTETTEAPDRCTAIMRVLKEAGADGITAKAIRELLKTADPDIRKKHINKILYAGVRSGGVERNEGTDKAPVFTVVGA